MATPALFHEYLYDSANLGFDGALAGNFSSFREQLQASFVGAAAGGPAPENLGFFEVEPGAAAARAPASVAHAGERAAGATRPAAASPSAVEGPHRVGAYGAQAASMERALLTTGAGAGAGVAAGGLPAPGGTLSPRSGRASAPAPGAALAVGSAQARQAAAAPHAGLGSGEGVVAPRAGLGPGEGAAAGARAATIFAPACQLHEMIDGPQFTSSHIGGVRFMDLLAGWFAGDATPTVIDAHLGPRGSGECGKDPAAAVAGGLPQVNTPSSNPSPGSSSGAYLPAPAPARDAAESRTLGPASVAQASGRPEGPYALAAPPAGGVPAPSGGSGGSGAAQAALVVPFRVEGIAF